MPPSTAPNPNNVVVNPPTLCLSVSKLKFSDKTEGNSWTQDAWEGGTVLASCDCELYGECDIASFLLRTIPRHTLTTYTLFSDTAPYWVDVDGYQTSLDRTRYQTAVPDRGNVIKPPLNITGGPKSAHHISTLSAPEHHFDYGNRLRAACSRPFLSTGLDAEVQHDRELERKKIRETQRRTEIEARFGEDAGNYIETCEQIGAAVSRGWMAENKLLFSGDLEAISPMSRMARERVARKRKGQEIALVGGAIRTSNRATYERDQRRQWLAQISVGSGIAPPRGQQSASSTGAPRVSERTTVSSGPKDGNQTAPERTTRKTEDQDPHHQEAEATTSEQQQVLDPRKHGRHTPGVGWVPDTFYMQGNGGAPDLFDSVKKMGERKRVIAARQGVGPKASIVLKMLKLKGFEVRFCAAEHAVAGGRGCGGIPVPILGERVPLHAARMIVREIFRAQTRMLPKAKKGGDLVLGSVLSNTDIRESRDRIVHPYVWVVGACCLCYVPLCTRCI